MTSSSRLRNLKDKADKDQQEASVNLLFPGRGDENLLSMVTRTLPQHILPLAILEVIQYVQIAITEGEKNYRREVEKEEQIYHQKVGEILQMVVNLSLTDEEKELDKDTVSAILIQRNIDLTHEKVVLMEEAYEVSIAKLENIHADFIPLEEMSEEDLLQYDKELASHEQGQLNLIEIFISALDRRQISRNGEGRTELLHLLASRKSGDDDESSGIQKLQIGGLDA